jgi:hypothetical protein
MVFCKNYVCTKESLNEVMGSRRYIKVNEAGTLEYWELKP